MGPPASAADSAAFHRLMRSDPRQCLELANRWIEAAPQDPDGYFRRHQVRLALGEPRMALADISRSIELHPSQMDYWCRGNLHRRLGDYPSAMADYLTAEAIDPAQWEADQHTLLHQADVHAQLGDEAAALACCARLKDNFWTPGPRDLPPGGKAEIAAELRRRAAAAKARTGQQPS